MDAIDVEGLAWRTSSFSGGNGNSCVEVAPVWRTSSFSGENGNSCVEVAALPAGIAVRDTKDRTRPPHLHSAAAWAAFVGAVRAGAFDDVR
jgi:hypothetical protein